MHYYQFHIADYRKDTTHLSPIEHYIYRQLIDWYYLDETPIPRETQAVIRRLGLGSDGLSNLENVLKDFFEDTDLGWEHKRIEAELDKYRLKGDRARKNGRKGGRPKKQELSEEGKPRKTQPVISGNPEKSGSKANQEPITNNQERKEKKFYSKEFETAWQAYPKREGGNPKNSAFKAWNARIRDGVTPEDMTEGIARYARYLKVKDMIGTQWVKQASVFFGPDKHYAEQWEVATPKPKRNGSGTAEDVGRAYEAEFGKPPPPGKTTDEVRAMISQRREKTATWLNG